MNKISLKHQLVILAVSISASILVFTILSITIIRPLVLLGQSKHWEEYLVISDTVKEKSTLIPSRIYVYKKIKTYEHHILYKDNEQEKNINVDTNEDNIRNLSLRKNPKTNELYIRIEFNIKDYTIAIYLTISIILIIALLVSKYISLKKKDG